MPYYYSAESAHGSESSHGFSNDTVVRVFDSKSARDRYVQNSGDLSVQAIKRADVTRHATNWSLNNNCSIKPKPFSGEYWGIFPNEPDDEHVPEGQIGIIGVCYYGDDFERFYK